MESGAVADDAGPGTSSTRTTMTQGRTARRWIHAALTLMGVTLAVAMAVVWNGAAAQEEEGTAAVGPLDAAEARRRLSSWWESVRERAPGG